MKLFDLLVVVDCAFGLSFVCVVCWCLNAYVVLILIVVKDLYCIYYVLLIVYVGSCDIVVLSLMIV